MKTKTGILVTLLLALVICIAPLSAFAAQPITITSVTVNDDATVDITWNNPNGGKVTVGSLVVDDGTAGNRIMAEFDVSGSSYTYRNLAPGLDYYLLVFPDVDLNNAGLELASIPEITRQFEDIYFDVQDANLTYFVTSGSNYSYNYAKDLTNDEIYDLLEKKEFWVKMDFNHVSFSYDQSFQSLTVVTSPTGYVTTSAVEITIPKYTTAFWQTMAYMNQAFADMYAATGEIPSGEYTVDFYLDGHFAGDSSFYIK